MRRGVPFAAEHFLRFAPPAIRAVHGLSAGSEHI
jgi:hypothetical protein